MTPSCVVRSRPRAQLPWLALLLTVLSSTLALGAGGPLEMSYVRSALGPEGIKDWIPVRAGVNASYLWVKFSPEMFKLEFSPSDIEGPKLPEWHVPYLIVTVSSFGPAMSYDGRPVSNIPMVFRGRWKVVPEEGPPAGRTRWVFTCSDPEERKAGFVTYDPKGSLLSPPLRLVDSKVRISVVLRDSYIARSEHKSFLDRITGALGFVTSIFTGCGKAFSALNLYTSARTTDRIGAARTILDFFDHERQPDNPAQKDAKLVQMDEIRWLAGDEDLPNGDTAYVPRHILLAPTAALKAAGLTDGFTSLEPVRQLVDSGGPVPVMLLTFDPVETLLPNTASSILNSLDPGDGLRKAFRGIRSASQAKDAAKLRALRAAAQMEAEARVDAGKFLDREVDTVDDAYLLEVASHMGSLSEAALALGVPESTIMAARLRSAPTSDAQVTVQIAQVAKSDRVLRSLGVETAEGMTGTGKSPSDPISDFGKPGGASWDRTKRVLDLVDPPGPEQKMDREAAEVLYWLRQAGIADPETEMRLRPYAARRFARDTAAKHGQEVSFETP